MYKDSKTVLITKIDGLNNEVEHTRVEGFPTIKLYRKGDNEVFDYTGDRTFDNLVSFIEANGGIEDIKV